MSRPSVILPSVKLFYSYRREEKEDCLKRLQELVDKLKDSFQFQHQIDESIAPPGTYFRDEILQAMRKSDIIFLLLTREYDVRGVPVGATGSDRTFSATASCGNPSARQG